MRPLGIRNRILLAALAPATLVALLISVVLVMEQMRQAHIDQHRRLEALARQLSATAEYNLFVGNAEALHGLLETALAEPDVVAAAILDPQGGVQASTLPAQRIPPLDSTIQGYGPPQSTEEMHHWHSLPIRATNYGEDDLFVGLKGDAAPLVGHLLMQISNRTLNDDLQQRAWMAALTALSLLVVGVLLALALSRELIRILGGIGEVVEGIGRGETHLRVGKIGTDELGHLAEGINEMAAAVAQTQDELAKRIDQATASLRQERDSAEAASRARGRFFAAASHDLRQPLQALGLFVARLEHDAQDSTLLPRVHQLAQTIHGMQSLLDTLLDYSRLDGQVYRVEQRPIRAADALRHLVDDFMAAAENKGLTLRAHIAACSLMTDPALLHRILLNLIGNAVRHTQSGGILVACRRRADHARIEIWDTGPGIPAESHEAIFDEMVQLDNPERDASKGLGLGLAIVKRTAKLLDHPLSLRSRVGRGSCFAIDVPLAIAPASDEEDAADDDDASPTPAHILLLGKSTHARDAMLDLLDAWGYAVTAIHDGEEAASWIEQHAAPDAIISEIPAGDSDAALAILITTLDWLEELAGQALPALIVVPGPMRSPIESSGIAPRLLLPRPFRPARLRALLTGILEPQDEADA